MSAINYRAFARHLKRPDDVVPPPEPQPIDPKLRILAEARARFTRMEDELADAQAKILAHFPDAVRLKLSKLILAAAERTEAAHAALRLYEAHGTLAPPRGAKPRKKRSFKP